tara:strand:- start:24 stop:350 length:327 start_codon:yes stop_codon:yes gene_type:complete
MTFKISDALASLRSGAEYVIRGGVIEFYQHDDPQPTADELQAELDRLEAAQPLVELREERNRRLAETDYLALSDVTLSEDMRTYRQALRDLPDNTSDPANPTWPVKPS